MYQFTTRVAVVLTFAFVSKLLICFRLVLNEISDSCTFKLNIRLSHRLAVWLNTYAHAFKRMIYEADMNHTSNCAVNLTWLMIKQ